ncbi:hypothetical protein DEA8626_01922 [Defluviimonas aquaemixtae]|uniref:Histidine phosphotransferase ChpT C-terminal domain-containing protein n=1 Tax=Albidovulum aquaemixtae TaxID=1542388 RepID=A0A2R8B725_9RHOB|nr:histidine phosphotransferase family protein [Defluviimonas aquaemixtae]SPH18384.1 hypothetical protein DEA8626_01922 [Defluviimonas aquaemixtae]
MQSDSPDLVALLGSRICHDLISPLGAIGNGVELLMMSGAAAGPEIALISESVTNANARIRFFRIAFGAAGDEQRVARTEIRSILEDMTRGGRLIVDWQAAGDPPRPEVKAALLALQCIETALPYGGRVKVDAENGSWRLVAKAERLNIDETLWSGLEGLSVGTDIAPAHVQFALLPLELARLGRTISVETAPGRIAIGF